MKRIWIAVAAVVIIAIIGAASVWYMTQQVTPPPEKKTVAVGTILEYTTFDPAQIYGSGCYIPAVQIFETLLRLDPKTGEYILCLAESYEQTSPTTYVFHLRKNVKFHDGTPFNASCVKYSIDRLVSMEKGVYYSYAAYHEKVEVVDDYTVKFTTVDPYVAFPYHLGEHCTAIVSPTSVEKWGDDFCVKGCAGTGPFKLVKWTPGNEIILGKNEEYWDTGRIPKYDQLIVKEFRDPSTLAMAIETGGIDIAYMGVYPEDYPRLMANPDIGYSVGEQEFAKYLFLCVDAWAPLKADLRVREAICYAIDYDKLLSISPSKRAYNVFTDFCFKDALEIHKKYSYDPVKARALLAEAGYPDGFSGGTLYYVPGWGAHEADYCAVIQSNLHDVGIEVDIQGLEWASLRQLADKNGAPMFLSRFSTFVPDPDYTFRGIYHRAGYNLKRITADFDWPDNLAGMNITAAIEAATTEQDVDKRIAMYQEIQEKIETKVLFYVYLLREESYLFYGADIKGAYQSPVLTPWATPLSWPEIEKT